MTRNSCVSNFLYESCIPFPGNCFVMLTSRPGDCYVSKLFKRRMTGLANIEGFSDENIKKCSELYLVNKEDSAAMLKQAKESGLYGLLKVPIVLLMACVVFIKNRALPNSETELFTTIFQLSMDRTTLKTMGCKSVEISNLDDLLVTLGLFSWRALQNDRQQLLLNRVCTSKYFENILSLDYL